ncbi:MAG: alpha/beta hydrolase [Chloroflexi bacterium]|nr:alpha/beta hydrolase [Chloroflexota bacterium]
MASATPTSKTIAVDGIRLHYLEWGRSGHPVVCVHGLSANAHFWDPIAEELAADYRVIAFDLRGRGDSDKPPSGYGFHYHAGDVCGLIERLGLGPVYLIGHSLGAMIAVYFAATFPQLVRKLVLVDGGTDVTRPEILAGLAASLSRLGQVYPSVEIYLDALKQAPFYRDQWNEYAERYVRFDFEAVEGGFRSKVPKQAIEAEINAQPGFRLRDLHRQIKAPTLILRAPHGLVTATDYVLSPVEAEAMRLAIANSDLVTVPDINHYTILLQKPPLVVAAIGEFLRRP